MLANSLLRGELRHLLQPSLGLFPCGRLRLEKLMGNPDAQKKDERDACANNR